MNRAHVRRGLTRREVLREPLVEARPSPREDVHLYPEEVLDFGDRFLVTIKLTGHGAGGGLPVSQPLFQLFTMRRGLIIRQDDFQERAAALETLGLSE